MAKKGALSVLDGIIFCLIFVPALLRFIIKLCFDKQEEGIDVISNGQQMIEWCCTTAAKRDFCLQWSLIYLTIIDILSLMVVGFFVQLLLLFCL